MALIKVINGKKYIIAEKNITDHNKLENRDAYGCHPIDAIRGLPEKITKLKEKDTELEEKINGLTTSSESTNGDLSTIKLSLEQAHSKIDDTKDKASKIDIVENSDSTFTFTNYNNESKTIQSGFLPDEDTLELNDNKRLVLNKVYTDDTLLGNGISQDKLSVNIDSTTIVKNANGTLFASALKTTDGFITGTFINNEIIELNKDIGDLTSDITRIDTKDNEQDNKISILETRSLGVGGYLTAYNFKKVTPTQDELTKYAKQELSISDQTKIPDQTRVKNLYNNSLWILNNHTTLDNQVVFNWINNGIDTISIATNEEAGLVKGSTEDYEGSIDTLGHISINGLNDAMTTLETIESDYASLTEQNDFTGKNNFTAETDFNGIAEHNADVHLNDSTIQISNTTKDTVTKIDVDKITIEKGTTTTKTQYNINLPSKSGTLVVDDDLTRSLNITDENNNYYAGGATPTASDKFSIVIGPEATSNGTGNIVYGTKADGPGDTTNSDGSTQVASSVVIGNYAGTHATATRSIVIGANARSEASGAIQLGMGTNSTANSVQFFNDNIYKKDTKTLTVKNAEIDGNSVYGLIKGSGAPSATTEGAVGQEYQDITNDKRYYCTSAGSAYTWQEVQNKLTQASTTMNAITGDTTNIIRIGNLLIQSITYTNVAGNSEKTWAFPITFDKLLIWNCNSTAEGQSINNGAAITAHSVNSLTVRTCGATSDISLFAIGWQAE